MSISSKRARRVRRRMVTTLDCDHCGGVAITKANGLFTDGEGDACETCGLRGCVFADSETEAYWHSSDDPEDLCKDPTCETCGSPDPHVAVGVTVTETRSTLKIGGSNG